MFVMREFNGAQILSRLGYLVTDIIARKPYQVPVPRRFCDTGNKIAAAPLVFYEQECFC